MNRLDALESATWTIRDGIGDIRLQRQAQDVHNAIAEARTLGSALGNLEVVGVVSGHHLRMRMIQEELAVIDFPGADPYTLFDDDQAIENARLAWDGDACAALQLPLAWTLTAFLTPESLILNKPPDIEIVITMEGATVIRNFRDAGLVNLGRYIPAKAKRRVYIALTGTSVPAHLGTVSFATADRASLEVPGPSVPLPGEETRTSLPFLAPYCLLPATPTDTTLTNLWNELIDYCRSAAAVATWITLASEVQILDHSVEIQFLGFRRVRFHLPNLEDFDTEQTAATLQLREWALQDASPDRILAISEVTSLYDKDNPFCNAGDIRASAEIIYIGLRSDAVAEVVKSSRDAQGQASETVRQALKSSQDLIKAAMERFLAGLVAVGAVVIANASRVLDDNISRLLMLFVSAFFLVLAAVAIFVEGPLLLLQMKYLDEDVHRSISLLTDEQRRSITNSSTVKATRLRIRLVRIVIPAVYCMLIFAILIWGYP